MSDREIAKQMIKDAEALAKEGQAKLDALDKSMLRPRHGWYGTNKYGDFRFVIKKEGNGLAIGGSIRLGFCCETLEDLQREGTEFGNFVDDLKLNSEDLKDFEVKPRICKNNGFSAKIDDTDTIAIGNIDNYWYYSLAEAIEIYQKLGQLIATAKRGNNEK